MSTEKLALGYDYRADGMFLVRWMCMHCGFEQDVIALANHRDYCDACQSMLDWEKEGRP